MKIEKTHAMRVLDAKGVAYRATVYDASGAFHPGEDAAALVGALPDAGRRSPCLPHQVEDVLEFPRGHAASLRPRNAGRRVASTDCSARSAATAMSICDEIRQMRLTGDSNEIKVRAEAADADRLGI
jgi:hypothetical protein